MRGPESSSVQIGEWIVHPALDSISRGTETRKLEPRAMRLLMCLANSAGEVVSIDRLLTEVWAGVVVGSASVYEAVSQLRKILGDVDPKPTYIKASHESDGLCSCFVPRRRRVRPSPSRTQIRSRGGQILSEASGRQRQTENIG
jgi:Transcriptional regulatory protein, C terminal